MYCFVLAFFTKPRAAAIALVTHIYLMLVGSLVVLLPSYQRRLLLPALHPTHQEQGGGICVCFSLVDVTALGLL